ncbi:unnamed protein product [Lactuca saligna]|uniref:Uncharacterized protein n=1 Tax=Lactuca saligna TaxID=75948 RepID=A0AA35ZXV8_LACSI|nr:unnamed protein product [Lactuca saligna]
MDSSSSCCRVHKRVVLNLDVGYNNLTGIIPHCLKELKAIVNGEEKWYESNGGGDSNENVIQVMKGVDLKYTRILDIVYSMDLSSNKLVGEIPVELTALSLLLGLNLSNNHLSGNIPNTIGNLTLQTLIDEPSIYGGDIDLCGPPLPNNCSDHQDPTTTAPKKKHKAVGESIKILFFMLRKKMIGSRGKGIPQELLGHVVLRGLARGVAGSLISLSG